MVKLSLTKRIRCYTLSGQSSNFKDLQTKIRSLLEQQSKFIGFESSPIDCLLKVSKSINLLLQVIMIIEKKLLESSTSLVLVISEDQYVALFNSLNTNRISLQQFRVTVSCSN